MLYYILNRTEVATSVEDILMNSNPDLQSITITRLGKSEDFCVSFVIDTLSDATVDEVSKRLDALLITSTENTQVG